MENKNIHPLRSERLEIYLPAPSKAPLVADFLSRNREHLARYNPTLPEQVYQAEFWVERLTKHLRDAIAGTDYRFYISPRDNPEMIVGSTSLSQIIRGPLQGCYLGYQIAQDYEGQGYMREAVEEVIGFAFESLKLHRIMANHLPDNLRSAGLLKRLGFEVNGYARDYLYINGRWQDHVLTALTNHKLSQPAN